MVFYRSLKEEQQLGIEEYLIFLILLNQGIIKGQLRKQIQGKREARGKGMSQTIMKMILKKENLRNQLRKNT